MKKKSDLDKKERKEVTEKNWSNIKAVVNEAAEVSVGKEARKEKNECSDNAFTMMVNHRRGKQD